MSDHAFIKLVKKSTQQDITLEELKDIFKYYQTITKKTGNQLDWGYGEAAFPYQIADLPDSDGNWLWLKSNGTARYKYIVFGVGHETIEDSEGNEASQAYIQVILPEGATHGDKGKANEFCKFLGKKLQAEVQLFNGRIMYFYKR
ncbi:DUF1885 family protein [Alkalihalobacillus sp. BA299]|uniref:DUF1885 family protein n=1 Tax=Alkalihalobacillus sp. BA299 TaxID=2815938 RepID=UPI001ADBC8F9|nr:DUF1885 family protein [Alkalihalobacillus sp. BA299]